MSTLTAPSKALRPQTPAPVTVRAAAAGLGQRILAMPFDAMRQQYAGAVSMGLAQRSILASSAMDQAVHAMETFTLGPLARQR